MLTADYIERILLSGQLLLNEVILVGSNVFGVDALRLQFAHADVIAADECADH